MSWIFAPLAAAAPIAPPTTPTPSQLDEAERAIRRLPPSAFEKLPRAIVRELERRRCTIPQRWLPDGGPKNVIQGEFYGRATKDWAVLCSRRGISTILVFRQGASTPFAMLSPVPDRQSLRSVPQLNGKIAFDRSLFTAGRDELLSMPAGPGGKLPPHVEHEGIDDHRPGHGWLFFYHVGKRWIVLRDKE